MVKPGLEDFRETMLTMMRMLNARIVAANALADELVEAADEAAGSAVAAAMLDHARRYRIESTGSQGRHALLSGDNARRFQEDL